MCDGALPPTASSRHAINPNFLSSWHREYDRLEAEARKHETKPKYSLAGPEHAALAKSTAELVCHPQLKGKVASAIKEVLVHGSALEELVIGVVSMPVLLNR